MTVSMNVPVTVVLALLREWQPRDRAAAELATEALSSLDVDAALNLAPAEVSVLIRVYRRRIGRGATQPGVVDLLAALEANSDPHVMAAAVSVGGVSIGLWFDCPVSTVVGCVVGKDRRAVT